MEANIIQIGNNHGLIIPADVLREAGLSSQSVVSMFVSNDSIVIKAKPREGWEAAAIKAHQLGDDKLIIPDYLNGENS
jgi:antitoxin component of MazEF toxin-antitoxin module